MTPPATIVVVPRERFSVAPRSLRSLYDNTSQPFELVYVDGRSPGPVRRAIEAEAARWQFTLIRSERYLSPNQARNLALPHVKTPYVVFVDNDIVFTPGWLEALLACAEETGAWVVAPVILEGDPDDKVVHNAGGGLAVVGEPGSRTIEMRNAYGHRPLAELVLESPRRQVDYVEFHGTLVRTTALQAIGGLDEGLRSTREHLDLCLQVTAAGGEIWCDAACQITFDNPPPVALSDLPFFSLRWSERWNYASLRHFATKYGLAESYIQRKAADSRSRRTVLFRPVANLASRLTRGRANRIVGIVLGSIEHLVNLGVTPIIARLGASGGEPKVLR